MSENHQTVDVNINIKAEKVKSINRGAPEKTFTAKQDFYALPFEWFDALIKAKLTGTELNLLLYCFEICADSQTAILPDMPNLLIELKMGRSTYFKAKKRLQKRGFLSFSANGRAVTITITTGA